MNDAPSTFVLVHGAWHDGWCWHLVARELAKAGHDVLAIDLPLAGSDGDVEAVETAVSNADTPVVLVAHSYGGTFIGEAASGRTDVRHLVYVCALATPIDQDANQAMAEGPKTAYEDSLRVEGQHVVCTRDRALHPELQERMATPCTNTVRVETDHSPFLSTPTALTRILLGVAD